MKKIKDISVDNPEGLQHRVFVNVMLHFARRGNEGLRQLKKTSFEIKEDENGKKYAHICHVEAR